MNPFIIRLPLFPHGIDYFNPFISQSSCSLVMGVSTLSLASIIFFGPLAFSDANEGKLLHGIAKVFFTGSSKDYMPVLTRLLHKEYRPRS